MNTNATHPADAAADLSAAIRSVADALDAMEQRQGQLAAEWHEARRRQREHLDQRVAALLPDFSDTTLQALQQATPAFAAEAKVIDAFARHEKRFWVFKSDGYDHALALLQTELKRHLEQLVSTDADAQAMTHLEAERATLGARQAELLQRLRQLEQAQQPGLPIPPEAARVVQRIAQRQRHMGRHGFGPGAAAPAAGAGAGAAWDDGADWDPEADPVLWLLDELRAAFVNAHAAAPSPTGAPNPATQAAPPAEPHPGTALQPHPQGEAIATDDRLGAFS